MRQSHKYLILVTLGLVAALGLFPAPSWAQNAVLDDEDQSDEDRATDQEQEQRMPHVPNAQWGVGVRLRSVFVPKGEIELFVETATSGISQFGVGLEVVRRKGNFEISVGLEQESLAADNGLFVEKGDTLPAGVDDVEFDGFGWFGIDATFIWHTPVTKAVSLRYGAGLGLGIIQGEIKHTDYICNSTTLVKGPGHCTEDLAGEKDVPYDTVPPVFPIINALVGAQIRPIENLAINIELGLRTVFYTGITATAYFF